MCMGVASKNQNAARGTFLYGPMGRSTLIHLYFIAKLYYLRRRLWHNLRNQIEKLYLRDIYGEILLKQSALCPIIILSEK